MTEASPEELFKIWAFRTALQRLKTLSPETVRWLAARAPTAVKAPAASVVAAAGEDDTVPSSQPPSSLEAVIKFVQSAAVFVTGGNLENLSQAAIIIFGVLVDLPEAVHFMTESLAFEEKAHQQQQQSESVAAVVADASGAETTAAAPPAPRAPKCVAKPKLLAAMWGQYYSVAPPAPRVRTAAPDLEVTMMANHLLSHSNTAGPKPAKNGQEKKKHKPEIEPRSTAVEAASTADDVLVVELEAPTGVKLTSTGGAKGARTGTRARSPPPVATGDLSAIAGRVSLLVQTLSVTTPPILLTRLRADPSFSHVTLADVKAAVKFLEAREFLVIDHDVIYPL